MHRRQGVLCKWTPGTTGFSHGYGFIAPDDRSPQVFVHSSEVSAITGLVLGARLEYTEECAVDNGHAARATAVVKLSGPSGPSQKRERSHSPSADDKRADAELDALRDHRKQRVAEVPPRSG